MYKIIIKTENYSQLGQEESIQTRRHVFIMVAISNARSG